MKPDDTTYHGVRLRTGAHVTRTDERGTEPLDVGPSRKLCVHSNTGFEWGYGGSGPAQLALAILLDFTGDPRRAEHLHQPFKWEKIARFDQPSFALAGVEIREWLETRAPEFGSPAEYCVDAEQGGTAPAEERKS